MYDLRTEMMLAMGQCGLKVESHHHEKASGGQCAIDIRYDELVPMADNVLKYKYVVKNVARRHGKTATFMPKPLYDEFGSGMNVHASLWKNGVNLFSGSGYSGLSDAARYAIGGILKHAPALCAITNPTTNSYKRLVPGFEAPTSLAYSQRNRSAAIRIPVYSSRPKSRRLEYRLPDGSANPYLAFAAVLMAMLDGMRQKTDPGEPLDKDIYDLPPEELKDVPRTPATLDEALSALETDHEFLLQGGVFTEDVIETWVRFKREEEVAAIRLRPHPYEFELYYDS
jgi:glutamine synthetase